MPAGRFLFLAQLSAHRGMPAGRFLILAQFSAHRGMPAGRFLFLAQLSAQSGMPAGRFPKKHCSNMLLYQNNAIRFLRISMHFLVI